MNTEKIIAETEKFAKSKLSGESSGHDWWHVYRVWQMALKIAVQEKADLFIIQLAALLHDIADWKFCNGDENAGPALASEWLKSQKVNEIVIAHVCEIIRDISFKGSGVKTPMRTIEGKIVQDADRLDALGAIGIARTFAYGGHKGREIYNPAIAPQTHNTFTEYKKNSGHTINHFYEKLLLLKDLMNTETAKQIAEKRHKFLELFLERFFSEWNNLD